MAGRSPDGGFLHTNSYRDVKFNFKYIHHKLHITIAKIKNSLYNNKWYEFLHLYGEQPSIKSYESCQVGNEAAISSVFMWRLFSIEV